MASSYSRVKRCTIPLGGDIHNEKNLALVYAQVNIIPFDILWPQETHGNPVFEIRYWLQKWNFYFKKERNASESGRQHFHWFIRRYFLFISVGLCILSVAVLSMWPCKNISHIQVLVTYFLPTPPIKLKLGVQIGGETTIANHKDQSLWSASQEQGAAVRSYLLHSSLPGVKLCDAFYQPQQTVQKCWAKTILLSQIDVFWLFFIQRWFAGSHTEHRWSCSHIPVFF